MDLGLLFTGGDLRITELVHLAREAEAAGFDSLCVAEAWRSAFVPLTAVAAATQRLRLGPYVLNAFGRSPLLAGMAAIDFNEFSGGRLVLGLGGGNRIINEQWQGLAHARVLTKMREYVTLIRLMASTRLGSRVDYTGQVHRMQWAPTVDPGPQIFPIVLAAVFPSMLKVAAQVADGIGGGATLGIDYLREVLRPQAAAAAAAVGRDPAALRWSAVGLLAMDVDRERARTAARAAICHLYAPLPHPYYEYTMREQGFGAAADALLRHMPAGRLDAAMAAIPEACIDALTIAGTPADCVARLQGYACVIDEMLLLNCSPTTPDGVLASYREVMTLPGALRSAQAN